MTRRDLLAFVCLPLAAGLAGGCGGPPAPESPPGAPPGYEALRETFGPADFGPLGGRIVVLDPGHGGHFRGARGPNGLAEADVNLGVALHLRGLLEWADADVHLTRTADRDFLTPADSTLTSDLAFRVSFVDSIQPDVFLSIHHNSNAIYDPTINETQTYHPLGADGASLDLARAVHRHLVRNLEISPAKILPGNFRVLRDATVPAILGEPSMISHPGVEKRLSLAAAQRLEAEAYFLGLLDYFSLGDPGWQAHQPDTVTVGPAGADLRWSFAPERRPDVDATESPGADPATFVLERDGKAVPHLLSADGATVQWTATALAGSAPAELALRGRNLAGRAAPVQRTRLVPADGSTLAVTITRDGAGTAEPRALVRWEVPGGAPPPRGQLAWPDGAELAVGPGAAPEVLLPATRFAGAPVFSAVDSVQVRVEVVGEELPEGWSWLPVQGPPPAVPWRTRFFRHRPLPPPAARIAVPHRAGADAWWTAAGRTALAWTAGVDPVADAATTTTILAPAFAGLTVIVDPAGGGRDPDGAGPGGLRGAEVNLGVARQLAVLLRGLGAEAVLTREGSLATGTTAKIALAERVDADFFLTIGRSDDGDSLRVRHHHDSRLGKPWAEHTAAALGILFGPGAVAEAQPSWAYLLRHTSCPALEIRLPHAANIDDERRLASPAWQAAEARAVLRGLAGGIDSALTAAFVPVARLILRPHGLVQLGSLRATFDGQLPWYPLPSGGEVAADSLRFWSDPGLPLLGGRHILETDTGRQLDIGAWRPDAAGGSFTVYWTLPSRFD